MSYTGSIPDTLTRPTDWLATAPCKADPDAMFPGTHPGDIEYAKSICNGCAAIDRCRQWALDTNEQHGVWGGLSEKDRRSVRRRTARGERPQLPPVTHTMQAPPKTLAEAFARRTQRTAAGHLLWYGVPQLRFEGVRYNALRLAFLLSHGREPEGPVRRTCGENCHRGSHLTDGRLRDENALCGTREGYQRHKKHREVPCTPCRKANTAADSRYKAAA